MSFEDQREAMTESLVRRGYIHSPRVIRAMRRVPRHLFVPESMTGSAYLDTPLGIGEGQTISAPHMVGIMLEALDIEPGQKVLEVGGGSGYHAALVGDMVRPNGHVYSIERIESLADRARRSLEAAGYADIVTIIVADGSKGWPPQAPYDRIFVSCGAPKVPEPLVDQLVDGGILLIPVGGRYTQRLTRIEKRGGKTKRKDFGGCLFVPLVGEYGF